MIKKKNFRKSYFIALFIISAFACVLIFFVYSNSVSAAITHTTLTQGSSGWDTTNATTASITPGANRLILLSIAQAASSGNGSPPSSITGNGLTWVRILPDIYDPGNHYGLYLYRAMGSSPTAGAISISFVGQTQDRFSWSVDEFDGVNTSGTNGSGAIGSTSTAAVWPSTSVNATLSSVGANSATFGLAVMALSGTMTAGTGYTLLGNQDNTHNHAYHFSTEWRVVGQTAVGFSFSSSGGPFFMGAVEIKAPTSANARKFRGRGVSR